MKNILQSNLKSDTIILPGYKIGMTALISILKILSKPKSEKKDKCLKNIRRKYMEELNLPSGKYSLIRKLKSDDKGNVFLAEHKTMGVKRIIKKAIGEGAYRKSLEREAYILSRLKSPFIPAVCDIEEMEGAFFIIEEYIEGQSLYDYIRENGIFEQQKGLETGVKLAKIIDFLHSGNSFRVCHLDIQPKNIIIKDNQIYLIDFGNSICDSADEACIMATKGFAPPEQYMSGFGKNMAHTMSADIYGFGAVLLYMLTGMYKENINPEETESLLRERAVNDRIIDIISNALDNKANCRQNSMSIICRQLDRAVTGKTVRCKENEPYIISVAGADRGTGATYIAVLLTALLKERGVGAIYEENHSRDTIRKLARTYSQIKYDKGCFTFRGITMKPKYNDNIHIQSECEVIVRDEGTVEECKEAGEYLIVVAQADLLGWAGLKSLTEQLEKDIKVYEKNISVIFNLCDEETYRREAALISCTKGFMEASFSPFYAKGQVFKGMEGILKRLLEEFKKGDGGCEEKYKSDIYRRDTKHWNNFRKKG